MTTDLYDWTHRNGHVPYLSPVFGDHGRGFTDNDGTLYASHDAFGNFRRDTTTGGPDYERRTGADVTGWRVACRCPREHDATDAATPSRHEWLGHLWRRVERPGDENLARGYVYAEDTDAGAPARAGLAEMFRASWTIHADYHDEAPQLAVAVAVLAARVRAARDEGMTWDALAQWCGLPETTVRLLGFTTKLRTRRGRRQRR